MHGEKADTKAHLLDEISKDLLCGCPKLADKMKDEGWTLLHCAVFEGREDLVTQICSVAPEMIEQKAAEGEEDIGVTALDVAFETRHENVLIRLFELCPNLIDAVGTDFWRDTVLHRAAEKGLDTVVAHLLAVKPELISAVTRNGETALDFAASEGHLAVVQRLLAASPALINAIDNDGRTVLHSAASGGNLAVVAHLLAAKPELIDVAENYFGWTALHHAVASGSVPVAGHLLAARPELISAVDKCGETVLHVAASRGNCAMVEYLLSVSPALIDAVDKLGSTALHDAALHSGPSLSILPVARALLAIKPDLISRTNNRGHTMLHRLVQHRECKEVIEEVWRLYPEALRVGNVKDTPFRAAITSDNFTAIELFQWKLTWEEIESAYASCNNNNNISSSKESFRPVMETQCESLSLWLLPEMVVTVFEYLGFERAKKGVEAASPPSSPHSSPPLLSSMRTERAQDKDNNGLHAHNTIDS